MISNLTCCFNIFSCASPSIFISSTILSDLNTMFIGPSISFLHPFCPLSTLLVFRLFLTSL
ncbi:hypothetical protein C8J55DRAFT_516919 [Lentinula edodes]|uniref:Uncharacterized protein n=1 Tax=Lentinula lateritia TaxID=40482 RepID=A0A9W9A7N8_9AGAR|nr:hypothetical protein C8J55DRAFT_516919 [Lentinula edodes]